MDDISQASFLKYSFLCTVFLSMQICETKDQGDLLLTHSIYNGEIGL